MKKLGKRSLSVLLALLMILTSVASASASLIETAGSGSMTLYVPEAVYLTPSSAGAGSNVAGQWYLNNTDGSGNYSYARGAESTGKFYFYCANATRISVTALFDNGVGYTSGLTTSVNGTTLNDDDFRIASGNTNQMLTWRVDYTCNDGVTRTAWAYTYVYKPERSPTGVALTAEGFNKKSCWLGIIQMMWGANTSDTGAYGCTPDFYIDGKGLYTANNTRPDNAGWVKTDYSPKYFSWRKGDRKETITLSAPRAYYYIDGSRYSNTDQLPNIRLGISMSDDEETSKTDFELYFQDGEGNTISTLVNSGGYVRTETVICNYAGTGKMNYIVRPSVASSSISSSGTKYRYYTVWKGVGNKGRGDARARGVSDFTFYNNNKSTLRNYYFNCINSGYGMQQERYTASSWNTYISALRHAGYVLGYAVVSSSDVTWAYNNLVNARNGLQVETHTAKARHVALIHTGSSSYVVTNLATGETTEETLTYTGGNTLTAKNNPYAGYTLYGYKANWDDTVGSSTYLADLPGITKTSSGVITNYRSDGDKYYTFFYTPNLYTVTLNNNNATVAGTANIFCSYGNAFFKDANYTEKMYSTMNNISVPSRAGYIFDGYYDAQTGGMRMINTSGFLTSNAITTAAASNVTWYARWIPIVYTINYNGNGATGGGTASSSHTYDVPKALTTNGFTREGFTFAGWSYSMGGTPAFANGASVNNLTTINGEQIELYAIWDINKYTIAYDGNGATGGATSPTLCTYNTNAAIADSGFTRTGYVFSGWSTEKDGKVTYKPGQTVKNLTEKNGETVILYAVWTPIKYKITFKDEDGTVLSTQMTDYDSVPVYSGKTPTKEQTVSTVYTFAGWSPELTAVTGEATYTATYTAAPRKYNVYFLGEKNETLYSEAFEYGTMPGFNGETPTKAKTQQYSYIFDGWKEEFKTVTGTQYYHVKFAPVLNKYTAKFFDYDGTLLWETTLDYGTQIVYGGDKKPVREKDVQFEYTFSDWNAPLGIITDDISFLPVFSSTLRSYTIRFVNYNGDLLKESSVEYGTSPAYDGITPEKPSTVEEQFAFAGWDSTLSECTGDKTYTAQFTASPRMYKISFVNFDGSLVKETEFGYGSIPFCDIIPAREAENKYTYTFSGWGDIKSVTGEATYTAQYSHEYTKHTITFVNDDGTVLQNTQFAWGETPVYSGAVPVKAATAQYTYTFKGWDKEIASVTEPATYTAQYTATVNEYDIVFKNYDGTVLKTYHLPYGTLPEYDGAKPEKPANAQYTYTFAGWDSEVSEVVGYAEYTASFTSTVNKYTVQFVSEDGSEIYDEQILEYGATPVYKGKEPTKARTQQYTYSFKGWDKEIDIVTGNIVYSARFDATVNKYTVKFVNYDGTLLSEQTLDYGTVPAYTGTAPTREAVAQYTYVWNAWDKEISALLEDTVYTAHFDEILNYYKITFKNYDGTILQDDKTFGYGTTPDYLGETPQKPRTPKYNYTFAGWTPAIDTVTGEAEYTAKFTEAVNKYHVIFKDHDGTVLQDTEVEYGSMPRYNGKTPVREHDDNYLYTFAGWQEEFKPIVGETVFNAKYSKRVNKFTVKFVDDKGVLLQSKSYNHGEIPVFDGTPVKPHDEQYHYVFAGWDKPIAAVTGFTTYVAVFAANAHEFVTVSETAPTCTESGKKVLSCPVCGFTFEQETQPTGHSYGKAFIENGKAYRECGTCGDRMEIPMSEAEKEQSLCKYCGKYHYKWIRPDFGWISCIISRFFTFLGSMFGKR